MVIVCSGISALFIVVPCRCTLRLFSDSLNHGSSPELNRELCSQRPGRLGLLYCHINRQAFLQANNNRSGGEIERCNQ